MNNKIASRFITGDGEMSNLIRNFDWSKTPVGEISIWPQSLLTTLNIMLNSKFPMFLFWGPELICFYNDAYRPSLGKEGKHPNILGSRGEDYWQEIWPVIKPLIDQVLAGGESTWSEDQLIPIYRNGKMEDVFWTFSYSAVNDESGNPFGVFVTCNETTDKVSTRKKLEESERKLRLSIHQAPVGIAVLRGNNYVVEIVNSHSLELWDRKEEEVINKPVLEAMPELADQGIKKLLDDVYMTGIPFSATEFPVVLRRNGKLENIYVTFVYEPIYDVDGTINGIMTVGSDVTEYVQGRKGVEESEQRSRLAIEAAEMGTFDWNLVTNEFISSQRLNDIFGFPDQRDITHKNLIDAFHPEDKPRRDEAVKNAAAKGSLIYEARIIWPDKSIHWVKVYGKITYKDQQPLKMYGTVIDITETKNTLSILQKSELHFKTISNVSPVGLWMTDAHAQNIFVNDTWIAWTGEPFENQLGIGWLSRVVEEDKQDAPAKFWDSMQKREKYVTEFRIIRPDGALQWCLTEGSPYYDIHGNFAGYAGSVTDITERKLIQEELEKKVTERTLQLKKSEERNFRMINEVQDYAILLLNKEGIIENWNKGRRKNKRIY
jgi:PAS domain S-box-containing protein